MVYISIHLLISPDFYPLDPKLLCKDSNLFCLVPAGAINDGLNSHHYFLSSWLCPIIGRVSVFVVIGYIKFHGNCMVRLVDKFQGFLSMYPHYTKQPLLNILPCEFPNNVNPVLQTFFFNVLNYKITTIMPFKACIIEQNCLDQYPFLLQCLSISDSQTKSNGFSGGVSLPSAF